MEQAMKDIAAGFISGWFQVLIMQPFEIVKIRLQTQTPGNAYYNGMIDCFKKIAKDEGLSAFYKGKITSYIRNCLTIDWYWFSILGYVLHLSSLQKIFQPIQGEQR